MAGLADFEVRNLTGTFAPTNGAVTMWDALPTEWRKSGQPSGADGVFAAWSGGRGDAAGRRLFARGGGHGDSSNNGLYLYDFNGDTKPTGWSVAPNSLSALAAVGSSGTVYADSKPTAVHSYDQSWFDPVLNRYYQISGSYYSIGNKAASYYYDFNTSRWSSDPGGGSFGSSSSLSAYAGTVFGKADGSKMVLIAGDTKVCFFTPGGVTTLAGNANMLNSDEGNMSSAHDSVNDRWLTVSYDAGQSLVYTHFVDWAGSAVATTRRTHASHATYMTANSEGGSIIYDAQLQCFWMFGFMRHWQTNPMSTQVLRMDANTFSITAHSLTGDAIAVASPGGGGGSFNRHVWFPAWRIVGTAQSHNAPASLIKLPSV